MINQERFKQHLLEPHATASNMRLCVVVRKRPLFEKEQVDGENDAVSVANPQIKVLAPKFRVDGITKYIDNTLFTFDNTFNEKEPTAEVYNSTLKTVLPDLFQRKNVTMFAYGQTGSGKTYTMVTSPDLPFTSKESPKA
jgi:kinesin family protein 2/24